MYYGCKKEIPDKRDYKLVSKTSHFPEQYKIKMPEVRDQGIVNSCVAHSLAVFLEEYYGKKYSTGFIYGYRPLGYYQGEGMYPREALKTLQKIGDVEEKDFSHNKEIPEIKKLVESDKERLEALASLSKIDSYARIYSESDIKSVLIKDVPVPISIPVKGDLELDEHNIIQITNEPVTGHHMVILYGWCEDGWLLQNSWGRHWGINGNAILPYDYEIDSAWAISTPDNPVEVKPKWYHKVIVWFKKLFDVIDYIFSS